MTVAEVFPSSGAQPNRFPLSANLELFCIFDKGDDEGAFGPRHLVNLGWRVTGEIDVPALRGALDDVVRRHEILRTEVIRGTGDDHQRVLPPTPVDLQVIDLPADDARSRDERADGFINEVEHFELRAAHLPHIRAVLGRFDERDAVLVLLTHHTASDGYSMAVLIREIAALYAQHKGFGPADLPAPVQYKEFSAWQQEALASENAQRAREYWRRKLDGAQMSMLTTDQPEGVPYGYAVHRQIFPRELATAAQNLAKGLRASPFMVLLAAFNALWYKMTGDADVVVPTLSSGRGEPRFAEAIGPFFNLVPLRTDLSDCPTFTALVTRTRATCLEAYAYDLPFAHIAAEAPDLNKPYEAGNLSACAFQSFQFPGLMEDTTVGDLTYTEVRRRVQSSSETSEIPNGIVFTVDLLPSGEIAAHARYNKADFLESTIEKLLGNYREILALVTTNPTIAVRDL
ncbi:condensation domain-containing protein [Amycolatopsis sp. NBC_01488]|uniref:condensation domain-containing protein n=1 Tax=Amycolatopsis sp. NBC_01488 TaxID=2903563 RepID=UPI002E2BD591|nr:condensation domain-containing protein [Amycolatopsis sp. NBC_01488]